MTGLYDNIDNLQNENNLTFLHRAPKITPNPLGKMALARIYRKAINVDEITSINMAEFAKGKIKNIRDELGLTSDEFNPYRKRLINKGIVNGKQDTVKVFFYRYLTDERNFKA